ncbi:MAG: hypothetical protein QM647_17885 [Asticcacaulis sp.]|uniref:hypothetical protein n=1 Tax=Asticcacaulis sp. TaxID=1872648 RepID=UPI0039E2C643
MVDAYRFKFFCDPDKRMMIVRPIGNMPGAVFVEKLHEAYMSVDKPWTYMRLKDFRRYEGVLSNSDIATMSANWAALTGDKDYETFVAIVSHDHYVQQRMPHVSAQFPHETICLFTGFHEAMGWLRADDKTAYLKSIDPLAPPRRDDGRIVVR